MRNTLPSDPPQPVAVHRIRAVLRSAPLLPGHDDRMRCGTSRGAPEIPIDAVAHQQCDRRPSGDSCRALRTRTSGRKRPTIVPHKSAISRLEERPRRHPTPPAPVTEACALIRPPPGLLHAGGGRFPPQGLHPALRRRDRVGPASTLAKRDARRKYPFLRTDGSAAPAHHALRPQHAPSLSNSREDASALPASGRRWPCYRVCLGEHQGPINGCAV